jgi:hypothetical protein
MEVKIAAAKRGNRLCRWPTRFVGFVSVEQGDSKSLLRTTWLSDWWVCGFRGRAWRSKSVSGCETGPGASSGLRRRSPLEAVLPVPGRARSRLVLRVAEAARAGATLETKRLRVPWHDTADAGRSITPGATSPRVTTKTATGTRSRMDGGLLRLLGPPQPATHLPAGPNGTRKPAARGLRDGDRPQPSSLASPQGLKVRNGERSQEPNRAKYQRFIQANHRSSWPPNSKQRAPHRRC